MRAFFTQLTITAITLLAIALPGFCGSLDDYYLNAFSEQPAGSAVQKAVLFQTAAPGEQAQCGTPLKHGLSRDWNRLEAATQKVLAKQLAAPVLSGDKKDVTSLTSPSGKFLIHYTTAGVDAVPSISWVQTVAQTFDDVAAAYSARGWRLAPTPSVAPYDVYLRELATQRLYGQTTSNQQLASAGFANAYGSYMEIDNNFTDSIYTGANGGPFSPTQSLQITAAHEYHHAIQYGYNYYFDIWYAEATSTWMEDELYDSVNQLYNYLPAWFSNSTKALDQTVGSDATSSGAGYSRWIFNRYLAEQHGIDTVRAAWEKLAGQSNNGADVVMAPVLDSLLATTYNSSLGSEVFGFAKRVYTGAWGSGAASHPQDLNLIHPYTATATLSNYPASLTSTLNHYSFAFYTFTPSASVSALSIAVNKTSGISTALFKKTSGTITEIAANSSGNYSVAGFSSLNAASDEVVLVVVNKSSTDGHQAAFSTNGSAAAVSEPSSTPSTSGGSGGGGCFIATAAYGSYLHPQVQLLRDFRDRQLLTNAPGRAFVALYYRFSPPLADFIAQHESVRAVTRVALTPLLFTVIHPIAAGLIAIMLLGSAYLSVRRRILVQTAVGNLVAIRAKM
ncbi:MAG TPA: hypothetical protein HPP94_06245 [Desulfuromonadales bacterium]|nr:hypothetical protein [Desulfuromonadales bacterium]